jgi:aryl-alcohol dehydrogenase-like predicted oxidoreductase
MKTTQLSNTGVEVSAFCLGTMYFGSKEDKATSYQLLDQYAEAGGSFLDTANIYAHWAANGVGGDSETLLGEWMRDRKNRERMFIASKVGFEYQDVPRRLTVSRIEEECNKSLKRLGIETIDLFYAHIDDRETPLEETLEAFDRLVKAGKVRLIGASNYLAWRLEEARWISQSNNWVEYCCVQQRYSYARPKPGASFAPQISANDDLLAYCCSRNFTVLAYSPLLGGAYVENRSDRTFADQYVSPDTDARVAMLKTVAEETGATPNQVILAWMVQSAQAVIPLVAASTTKQMQENLNALNLTLTEDQLMRLDVVSG